MSWRGAAGGHDCRRGQSRDDVPARNRFARHLCGAFLVGLLNAAALADAGRAVSGSEAVAYDDLARAKAMAIRPGSPTSSAAVSHGQPNDLAAARQALQQCQAQSSAAEPCEVVRLNDEQVTTARAILDGVPEAPHPLYLWEYRQGQSTVYLAGSIHVLKPALYPLPPQLYGAFERSDYLAVEVDPSRYPRDELQRLTADYGLLTAGKTLREVLPASLAQRLERRLEAYGIPLAALPNAKPAMMMNQLVMARLMALGYQPEYGVEQHFLGRRTHQKVLELESLEAQLELLFDQPLDMQIQLLADSLDMELEIEPTLAGLLTAWFSGDDAAFLRLFTTQTGDSDLAQAFSRLLLNERNPGMADGIRGYLQNPGTYFVLVGAAHLVGDHGVVSLLQDAGIRGRRISSSDTL